MVAQYSNLLLTIALYRLLSVTFNVTSHLCYKRGLFIRAFIHNTHVRLAIVTNLVLKYIQIECWLTSGQTDILNYELYISSTFY